MRWYQYLFGLLSLTILHAGYSEVISHPVSPVSGKATKEAAKTSDESKYAVYLYSMPTVYAEKLTQITPINASSFVQIYRSKKWVKVANLNNGQVGWINLKEIQDQNKRHNAVKKLTAIEQTKADYATLKTDLALIKHEQARAEAAKVQFMKNYQITMHGLNQEIILIENKMQLIKSHENHQDKNIESKKESKAQKI